MKNKNSIQNRYKYKLFTNLINLPIAFITQAIIPRILGVSSFGDFSFITGTFTQIIAFLDSGTSIGFYTLLSKNNADKNLMGFYFKFILGVFLLLLLLLAGIYCLNFEHLVWPNQDIKFIFMGLFWAMLTWNFQIFQKIFDALGYTKKGEVIRMSQKIFGCLLLIFFFFCYNLSLGAFFVYHYTVFAFYFYFSIRFLKRNNINLFKWKISKQNYYILKFYRYSAPLVIYSLVSMIVGIFGRWLIQHFYGSEEQAYFGLANQLSALCFIFTSAMTPIFMREMAVAHKKKSKIRMRYLMNKYIPLLYFVACVLSVFICLNSDIASLIMGGSEYKSAYFTISLMVLYPIHQTYGQLCSSVFYSTENTKLYRNIGSALTIVWCPFMYFFIAPSKYLGLELGAEGLAYVMIISQVVNVNVFLYFIRKMIFINMIKLVLNQFFSFLSVFLVGYIVHYFMNGVFQNQYLVFFTEGIIYLLVIGTILYCFPDFVSMKRKKMEAIFLNVFK